MQPTEQVSPDQIVAQAEAWREPIVGFTKALLRIPSLTGEEGALAEAFAEHLRALGYDEVFTDEIGNVIGRIKGDGTGPTTLFTAPLDHLPAGDRAAWQHDPFGAEEAGGFLHGRGASDHKGALAAMAYGGALLKRLGARPRGDYLLAAVVQHHAMASVGMRFLVDKTLPGRGWHYDLVVMGNPTNLDVHLSHRGRVELEVLTIGRTSHAGAPWLGVNAVYKMTPVIEGVQDLATNLPSHPFLDKSTLALVDIRCAPEGTHAVPDRCVITLDRRFLPSESVDDVVWQVQSIVNRLATQDPEFKAEVGVHQLVATAYTGLTQNVGRLMHPLINDASHGLVRETAAALEALGQHPRFNKWTFTTDGGYTSTVKNIVTLGYAPGDEKFAQTPFDRVKVDQLIQAAAGYAAICLKIAG